MTPEEYYKKEFTEDYKLVKNIKEQYLFNFKSVMNFAEMYHIEQLKLKQMEQLTLNEVGNCPFEAYAVFCIECDRKGMKPMKYKDYLNLG